MSSHGFGVLVLLVVGCGTSNAFIEKIPQRSIPAHSRHTAATMCSLVPEGKLVSLSETLLARRSFLAASLASAISVQRVGAAEDTGDAAEGGATEVVVEGELRLEKGSDQKLQKAGGKGRAEVVLRCVGKGIISKTTEDISLDDFPAAGRPGAEGESGGVPFVVTVGDLVAKTEKGRIVNRELWGDDDIFVAVDVYAVDNPKKRILRGIGKAKYKEGLHQKPLVLLE